MIYLESYNGFDAYNDLKVWKNAIKNGHINTIKTMIKEGFYINKKFSENGFNSINSLVYAIFYDKMNIARLLINNGIDLDIIDPSNETTVLSSLILKYHLYKEYNVLSLFKLMIKKGADVNFQDSNDFTALMIAAEYGVNEMIYILINAGADWNLKNKYRKDFIDIIGNWPGLFKKYPEKYQEYLKRKNIKKFKI